MQRGTAPADRDLQERALQGWEWPWEVTAPSPWQAWLGWDGSLRNVCLNHAKVIKVYDLIEPPIPLWTRHDHPPQLSALFPGHIWCSVGFIPISVVKPANTSLHFCNMNYKKISAFTREWVDSLNIRAHVPQKLWQLDQLPQNLQAGPKLGKIPESQRLG